MFKEMRRKERQLEETKALNILHDGEYGVLGTVGENGYPYTVPLNYVLADRKIYLHCAAAGHKLDNLAFNSKVSFCVVGRYKIVPEKFTTEYESVIVFGRASLVEGDEKKEAMMKLVDKYAAAFRAEGEKTIDRVLSRVQVVKIEVDRITGKRNEG